MRKKILKNLLLNKNLFVFMLLCFVVEARAQKVMIPDSNFARYLKTTFPSCVSGTNMLDTTCAGIRNAKTMNLNFKNISNLEGIQYFSSLTELTCAANKISQILKLPANLKKLSCQDNYMKYVAMLPPKLEYFFCQDNGLRTVPPLPNTLTYLNIHGNYITSLPALPKGLKYFYGEYGKLDSLPVLPDSLEELSYTNCGLKKLPKLPPKLKLLHISNSQITEIPNMPPGLKFLIADNCKLGKLPDLPSSLRVLICHNNILSELPALPPNLIVLHCGFNKIKCLPTIPLTLKDTANVYLARWVWFNMKGISLENNLFTCLPNYVSNMDSSLLAYPICREGDSVNNAFGCKGAVSVKGRVFVDDNLNCKFDAGEKPMKNFAISLRDASNQLLSRQTSLSNGAYNFLYPIGNYTVDIDTSELPVLVHCRGGETFKIDHNYFGQQSKDIDFALTCGQADIGVKSVIAQGIVFPGRKHSLSIQAGDLSQWYGLKCASGYGGQVSVSITGKVQYFGASKNAKQPSNVNGNQLTYQVVDFGEINIFKDFGVELLVDTNAQIGDSVIVEVELLSNFKDKNLKNNRLRIAYRIVNSFDPNFIEVYPSEVPPSYNDWLTYTVHFQNTGTAMAYDITVTDIMDPMLSPETFEVLSSSHTMRTDLKGKTVNFIFADIMLPDSNVHYDSSCGFVQFRIKPSNLYSKGTQIPNKANIYFDYNKPVLTNTAICEYKVYANSLDKSADHDFLSVFPNPSNGKIQIKSAEGFELSVKDLRGKELMNVSNQFELELPKGIYFFEFMIENARVVKKVVVL